MVRGRRPLGFELELGSAPVATTSMHTARRDLQLAKRWMTQAGKQRLRLAPEIEALPLAQLGDIEPP